MTKGVSIGKDVAVSGARSDGAMPRKVSVWSGSARRKQRDHGAAVCLLQDGGRGGCGCFSGECVAPCQASAVSAALSVCDTQPMRGTVWPPAHDKVG